MIWVNSSSHLVCLPICFVTSGVFTGEITVEADLVRRSVQSHGSDQWYDIGLEMGFTDSYLRTITDSIPTYPGKVRAIFEAKAKEIGRENAAISLLQVCKTIPNPIDGIVEEELKKSQCN